MKGIALTLLSLLAPILAGCGGENGEPRRPALPKASTPHWIYTSVHYDTLAANPQQLQGGFESDTALIRAGLDAIAASDTGRMAELVVTAAEFDSIVYPELGKHIAAARDSRPEAQGLLRSQDILNSEKNLGGILRELGSDRYRLVEIDYDTIRTYVSYRLLERPTAILESPDGREVTTEMFGSIIEKDGEYKLLSWRSPDFVRSVE